MEWNSMGNEIFYCIQCGIRVSGSEFEVDAHGPRGDRSHCPFCLGIPPKAAPLGKETSHRIRRTSSSSAIQARRPSSSHTLSVIAARPRATDVRPRKTVRTVGFAALALVGAAVASVLAVTPNPPSIPAANRASPPVVALAVPAPVQPQIAAVVPPAPPLEAERAAFLTRLEQLREQAQHPADPDQDDRVLEAIAGAVVVASRLAPERSSEIDSWEKAFRARHEALADSFHDSIVEAANGLADEGRFEDALARIRAFPNGLRTSRAWTSLEGLRRQIEQRAR